MLGWIKDKLSARAGAYSAPPAAQEAAVLKQRGNALLDSGAWEQAEACYRQAIALAPADLDAQVNLGYVLIEQQRHAEARQALLHALRLDGHAADAHYMLGTLALAQGDAAAAIEYFETVLRIKPAFDMGYRDLLHALSQQGRTERARQVVLQGLAHFPERPDFHYYLGNLQARAGEPDAAIESFRKAVSLQPDFAEAHNSLGSLLQRQGKPDQAIESYQKALALKPDFGIACGNMGTALQARGDLDAAIALYRRALELAPSDADMHINLGSALQAQGQLDAAADSYARGLALNPDLPEAHNNMGSLLQAQGKYDAAVESYRKALALKPGFARARLNLGSAFHERGDLDTAIDCYDEALLHDPGLAEVHVNLGSALQGRGQVSAAIERYRQAIALKPDFILAYSNLLFAMSFHRGSSPADYVEQARRYGRKLLEQARPYTAWQVRPASEGALRVGLVSGDLNEHPVAFFLENILAQLDPARIELVAYPTQGREDAMTARLKQRCAQWVPLMGLTDQAAARRIHDDGIHILIDLAGHTAHNRLPVFAWKPAPLQVSWLGYLASTGVPGIDYVFADPVSVPPRNEYQFTEKVWRLPHSLNCFTPPQPAPKLEVAPLPALKNGYVTFGSFQNLAKVDDAALAVWGRVLQALPTARLRLQMKQMSRASARDDIVQRMARVGITGERLILSGGVAQREDYLATHGEVDIILDTFPYVGITTTCEALWMGVPTVTLAGDTLLSRQGAALLTCAGLEDWIAADENDYVDKAVAHASAPDKLAQLRQTLRARSLASPLFNAPQFAQHLQQALYAMWEGHHV